MASKPSVSIRANPGRRRSSGIASPRGSSRSRGAEPMNLDYAYEAYQAGRYADAARLYQALLDRDPDDANVLHLFGVMHHQCGYFERAAELTGQAIARRPDVAAYHA